MEFATFPKNLAYNIKTLSGFSKTTVKLTPERTSVQKGDTFKVKLPSNTLIDLRTLSFFAKGTCENAGANPLHFPRLTSSLIKTLAVYINGTLIERIDNYNILYNKLYDLDGGGIDQIAKRHLEIADPSIRYTVADDHTNGSPEITTSSATSRDENRKLAINNWIGFLSSVSCPCLDTNDFGSMEIEITLADEKILWAGANANTITNFRTVAPAISAANWKLDEVHFTISKIVFNDPLYYNMKASKLLSSGLQIGYQTYIASKGSVVQKGTSVNVNCTVNSTSLDQLICCYNPEAPAIAQLLLFGSNDADDGMCFQQVLSGFSRKTTKTGADVAGLVIEVNSITGQTSANAFDNSAGDLYNQSVFFKSDATDLRTSSIEINNTPLMPQPLEDYEVYNETLIALGNNNLDMGSGVHPGCNSLSAFLKYYFCHVVSLENIQNGDFYKSGLDGKASALNIVWKSVYNSATGNATPYIFAKTTRIVQVNEGHSVVVIV